MTENDAPESTRARIGFLSIITSSWLPVILAVDGGFPVHAASPPWKVALLSFPRSYGLATDWIGDMATGICNDVLGIGLSRTWRKTARRVWSAYFFFLCQRRRSSVGGFEGCQRQPFSLGSSALHVQDVRSGNKQVCCQPFSTHLFFLVQVGISEQELCISWLQRRMLVVV
ncbi:hypothetical protein TNCV_1990131 [Trichonephila clavipes]|nr:hypothetical protein TNCV_1990131 [Trichonephila clavipes]